MSVITLTTDFGDTDEYVGVLKGVILGINPQAQIVDITHRIDPQDLIQAAVVVQSAYAYFPPGTVHVVVIDPGVGGDRSVLAMQLGGHTFLAPNNGVLSRVMETAQIEIIIQVENREFFLQPVSRTFHGRDIFAPVAAHLSKGLKIEKLGTRPNEHYIETLKIPKPEASDSRVLTGIIVSIDRFGNLITNIDLKCLNSFCKRDKEQPEFRIGGYRIKGLSKNYASAGTSVPVALIGSRGYLEIAVNCGSAGAFFKVQKGDPVIVTLSG